MLGDALLHTAVLHSVSEASREECDSVEYPCSLGRLGGSCSYAQHWLCSCPCGPADSSL